MLEPNSNNLKTLSQHKIQDELLSAFYYASIINRFPVAVWRLPGKSKLQSCIDLFGTYSQINIDLARIPSGFIISPFISSGDKSTLLIRSNLHLIDSKYTYDFKANERDYSQITKNKLRFENTLEKLIEARKRDNSEPILHFVKDWYYKQTNKTASPFVSKTAFCLWVEKAIEQIKEKSLSKVVLSRAVEVELKSNFKAFDLFSRLCAVYPNAFVSLVALPDIGTWIGASPELLLSVKDNRVSTEALAGTRPDSSIPDLPSIKWGEKELKEQAIVSDFIRNCLSRQTVTDYSEHGPVTVRAGNLLHIQTKFNVKLSKEKDWETVNQILSDLHPTPAVCGFPKKEALDFISAHENYKREFYAGFLGPVNISGQTQLHVNLRCMQLKSQSAILYAGAGITKESEPEKEWWETELKLNSFRKYVSIDPIETNSDISKLAVNPELIRQGTLG
jgi:isochorismate synthase